jgi:predicted RNase H-like nuclease
LLKQLYNIVAKIKEVDAVQSPERQRSLFEACPELSFAVMADDAPMQHSGVDVPALGARAPGTQPDDVLDALVLAWTTRRYLGGSCLRLGGELDATGLRMEVVA